MGKAIVMILSLWGISQSAMAEHTLKESVELFNQGHTHKNILVLKVADRHEVQIRGDEVSATGGFRFLLNSPAAYEVSRLFKRGIKTYQQERLQIESDTQVSLPHLENHLLYRFEKDLSSDEAEKILTQAYSKYGIEYAYFEPKVVPAEVPVYSAAKPQVNNADTPSFMDKQFHLEPAPRGVGAFFAWQKSGGDGKGVKVIDVEFGWTHDHEDFSEPFWNNGISRAWQDHGTAVWGIVAGKKDHKGISGIAHQADFGTAGDTYSSTAATYDEAAAELNAGDIMIIEQQANGPDQGAYTAMEYFGANFDAIKVITAKGIHVVEAGANGSSNLDDASYNGAFDLGKRDSGAILVGAGAPPTWETHLERLDFSNYGARIDAMGYGRNVTTAGYGDLFNQGDERAYTENFAGTSSATPIVAGSVASLVGIGKAKGIVLTPKQVRDALRATGTRQRGNLSERIGNLPDLEQLTKAFGF